MTEAQAEKRLRILLKMTTDRGTTQPEQENATRRIGEILQAFPQLRYIIAEAREEQERVASASRQSADTWEPESRSFWKGLVAGVAGAAVAVGIVALATVMKGQARKS